MSDNFKLTLNRFTDTEILLSMHQKWLDLNSMSLWMKSPGFLRPRPDPPVSTDLFDLNPANRVDIRKLTSVKTIGKQLEGKVFLCRTIAPAHTTLSVNLVVQDPEGEKAVLLALYNYGFEIPVATVLAIKNPLFKATRDGGFGVRCDIASEVQIISETELQAKLPNLKWESEIPIQFQPQQTTIVTSAANLFARELKNRGNKHFVDKEYSQAIEVYSQALEQEGASDPELLSNRGLAFLKMRCFNRALTDLNQLLSVHESHIKGIYRKAKALFGLRRYNDAVEFLELKRKSEDLRKNKDLTELLNTAKRYSTESQTGELDMDHLLNAKYNEETNAPEYTGNVEVKNVEEKGRGLFAAQDFSPGQLILSHKAFAIYCKSKGNSQENNLDRKSNRFYTPDVNALVDTISSKLRLEPEVGSELCSLFAGSKVTPIDVTSLHNIDINRLGEIVNRNSFVGGTTEDSLGLWILPSYINHSCTGVNSCWFVLGDILLVRAIKPIKKGDEITISYKDPTQWDQRSELFKNLGFVCKCHLCCFLEMDECSEEVRRERKRLMTDFSMFLERSRNDQLREDEVIDAFNNISKLESLGTIDHPHLILALVSSALWQVLDELCKIKIGRYADGVELMEKLYFINKDAGLARETVMIASRVIVSYLNLNNKKLAEKWLKIFREDYKTAYGCNVYTSDTYTMIFPIIDKLRKAGINFYESDEL